MAIAVILAVLLMGIIQPAWYWYFPIAFLCLAVVFGAVIWWDSRMEASRRVWMARPVIAFPANVPCPVCGGVVQDWHTEWTDPAQAPDFYRGLNALDCPLCGAWVLYKEQKIQAVPPGDNPQKVRRLPLQAARWAKSQSRQGYLRDYLDQNPPGQQYRGYFTDQEVQDADADAQADPRY